MSKSIRRIHLGGGKIQGKIIVHLNAMGGVVVNMLALHPKDRQFITERRHKASLRRSQASVLPLF